MARAQIDDEEKPLDPAVERLRRKLVRFIVINLGLLFFVLMVVIAALVYKSRHRPPAPVTAGETAAPAGEPASADIVLPAGAKVVLQSLSGDRLLLDVELAEGGRVIFVYDIVKRRMIGRFSIRSQ